MLNENFHDIMTPQQADRIKLKIHKIRQTLAAEKRKFGSYDDSWGRRYLPPAYYLQLEDYKSGLTYMRWFKKNFPDDICYPEFLFEWTVILFKSGRKKEAEQKAFETFCSNTYLFDKFFGRSLQPIDKYEWAASETPEYIEGFSYHSSQPIFADFADWLHWLIATEDFAAKSQRFVSIHLQLLHEKDDKRRQLLLREARQICGDEEY